MIGFYDILSDLAKPFEGLTDMVALRERPKSVPDAMKSFIVVDIPNLVYDRVNEQSFYSTSYCTFEVYVRDTAGSIDMPFMRNIEEQVMSKFPIHGEHAHAEKARKALSGDDNGFSILLIQATLKVY